MPKTPPRRKSSHERKLRRQNVERARSREVRSQELPRGDSRRTPTAPSLGSDRKASRTAFTSPRMADTSGFSRKTTSAEPAAIPRLTAAANPRFRWFEITSRSGQVARATSAAPSPGELSTRKNLAEGPNASPAAARLSRSTSVLWKLTSTISSQVSPTKALPNIPPAIGRATWAGPPPLPAYVAVSFLHVSRSLKSNRRSAEQEIRVTPVGSSGALLYPPTSPFSIAFGTR